MKTCYMCGGDVERRIVEVEDVIVKDVPVEVCTRCGEKYFNRISDKIISYAYSDIDPNDATRVLLVLENV